MAPVSPVRTSKAAVARCAAALLALAPLACSCAALPNLSASNGEPAPAIDRKLPATPETRAATP